MYNKNQVVPVVRDVERGIDANPTVVFSEGQLNVVALSYFLGMAMNAREAALPFLILDDPLQALDVIAILGFSDLARRIREHRRLIVTTHDRRFADVLARKLSPRDTGEKRAKRLVSFWINAPGHGHSNRWTGSRGARGWRERPRRARHRETVAWAIPDSQAINRGPQPVLIRASQTRSWTSSLTRPG
jgi:energy-coupling factor transporter ATP-binding protein EcfA2